MTEEQLAEFEDLKMQVRSQGQQIAQLKQSTQVGLADKWNSKDGMELLTQMQERHMADIAAVRDALAALAAER